MFFQEAGPSSWQKPGAFWTIGRSAHYAESEKKFTECRTGLFSTGGEALSIIK